MIKQFKEIKEHLSPDDIYVSIKILNIVLIIIHLVSLK